MGRRHYYHRRYQNMAGSARSSRRLVIFLPSFFSTLLVTSYYEYSRLRKDRRAVFAPFPLDDTVFLPAVYMERESYREEVPRECCWPVFFDADYGDGVIDEHSEGGYMMGVCSCFMVYIWVIAVYRSDPFRDVLFRFRVETV